MTQETAKMASILEVIPYEIVIKILSFVPQEDLLKGFSLVSKKCYEISHDSALWSNIKIEPRWSSEKSLLILRKTSSVKSFTCPPHRNMDYIIENAFRMCPQLQAIDIATPTIFVGTGHSLKKLKQAKIKFNNGSDPEVFLNLMAENCDQLELFHVNSRYDNESNFVVPPRHFSPMLLPNIVIRCCCATLLPNIVVQP